MSTIKQKRVVGKILENRGNVTKAMRASGYTKASTHNPQQLIRSKGFQEEARPLLKRLEGLRDAAIAHLEKNGDKMEEAKYRDLTDSIEKFAKLTELIAGRPTDRRAGDFEGWTPQEVMEYGTSGIRPARFQDEG